MVDRFLEFWHPAALQHCSPTGMMAIMDLSPRAYLSKVFRIHEDV